MKNRLLKKLSLIQKMKINKSKKDFTIIESNIIGNRELLNLHFTDDIHRSFNLAHKPGNEWHVTKILKTMI